MKLNSFIDNLVYKGDKELPDNYRKGRFFILAIGIFLLLNLISIPYYLGETLNLPSFIKGLYLLTLFFLFSIIFIYRKYGYRIQLANIYFLTATIYQGYSNYVSGGGLFSPDNAFTIVSCIFVFLIANKISGYVWLAVNVVIMSFFYYAEIEGLFPFRATANRLPADYFFSSYIFSLAFATIAILLHESSKEKYLKEIISAKSEIELKNKEITESITYARRIQHAKLPSAEEISKALPESFILFKPKDIVSGDFYFFLKKSEEGKEDILLAAADCTGHGVPGALMSMIGSEQLMDAAFQSSDPGFILKKLNQGIRKTLKQTAHFDSTHDGMDIALVKMEDLDQNRVKLSFSGANRPLWLIRKKEGISESRELEIFKPTKKAIGGYTVDEQDFSTDELILSKGDSFYLFSDGYADCFSGRGGKKLTTKKFKEILLSVQDKNMIEQKSYLDDFIEDWKGGIEQVDDILVIGVRI